MNESERAIEKLRALRQRRAPGSIEHLIQGVRANAERSHQRLGDLIDLWEELVPAPIASSSRIIALRGGTAHVAVTDAAVAYALDRELRGGLEASLRSRFRRTLLRVRVRVSPRDVLGSEG